MQTAQKKTRKACSKVMEMNGGVNVGKENKEKTKLMDYKHRELTFSNDI